MVAQGKYIKRNLNFEKAKSAHLAAFLPSLPNMPMPTWASCIIDTSFAPSPIAAVIGLSLLSFTNLTTFYILSILKIINKTINKLKRTSAFCAGDILQHKTAVHFKHISLKSFTDSLDFIRIANVAPSITNAKDKILAVLLVVKILFN